MWTELVERVLFFGVMQARSDAARILTELVASGALSLDERDAIEERLQASVNEVEAQVRSLFHPK